MNDRRLEGAESQAIVSMDPPRKVRLMKNMLFLALALALVVGAQPVAAKGKERVGEAFNIILGTPITFPEGEAFHIAHGWGLNKKNEAKEVDFQLDVDGVRTEAHFVEHSKNKEERSVTWLRVYNFPDGMVGTHSFIGHWFASCQWLVDNGSELGPCEDPDEKLEAFTAVLTVTFEQP